MTEKVKIRPVSVRLDHRDYARIEELFKFSGIRGNLSALIQTAVHAQILIEEINRGRYPADEALISAIHTLQQAVDRRDSHSAEKGSQSSDNRAEEEGERE